MNPVIPSAFYFEPAILERERELLFGSGWQFIGFARDLAVPNSFITGDAGGHSVVVQNFGGELRAFRNSCSHRFSRIQCDAKGVRPLRCPYHGWTYDRSGEPTGIPARPRFDGLTPERTRSLALMPYRFARCGDLLFVSPGGGPALESHLGAALPTLRAFGDALGAEVDCMRLRINANWKVAIENTLEAYHVPFVHGQTFNKLSLEFRDQHAAGLHTWWRGRFSDKAQSEFSRNARFFQGRPWPEEGYYHQFIFPNLTLATSFGTTFSVQSFTPVDAETTELVSYLFETKLPADSEAAVPQRVFLNESAANFNRRVFEEDAKICETVQLGIHDARPGAGILSDEELRVLSFHRAYMDLMRP